MSRSERIKPDPRVRNRFRALVEELRQSPAVEVEQARMTFYAPHEVRAAALAAGVPSSVHRYYHSTDGFELSWTAVDQEDPDVLGTVRILPLRQVVQDWRGVVHFEGEATDSELLHFKPLDTFTNETCAGVFTTAVDDESLYIYDFEDEPVRLDLDVFGYTEMLYTARGFFYWPHAVIAAKGIRDTREADRFRTAMPALFPDFSWSGSSSSTRGCACRTGDGHGRGVGRYRSRSTGSEPDRDRIRCVARRCPPPARDRRDGRGRARQERRRARRSCGGPVRGAAERRSGPTCAASNRA